MRGAGGFRVTEEAVYLGEGGENVGLMGLTCRFDDEVPVKGEVVAPELAVMLGPLEYDPLFLLSIVSEG